MDTSNKVSIGICAHNEEETIGTLLEQISREDIPIKEVIIAVAGKDNTASIAEEKKELFEKTNIIEEQRRQGQIFAQNKILDEMKGDSLLLIDGDGLIKPGSLEKLLEHYDGECIVSGKEVPITKDCLTGRIIDFYGKAHHEMCLIKPRFSTHLGIIPENLTSEFPEVVLDDAVIENRAYERNLDIKYVPEAVKFHNTSNKINLFYSQQRKNWAGRFQAENLGIRHSKSKKTMILGFLLAIKTKSLRVIPAAIILLLIELAAFISGIVDRLKEKYPIKWKRK